MCGITQPRLDAGSNQAIARERYVRPEEGIVFTFLLIVVSQNESVKVKGFSGGGRRYL